MEAGAQGFQAGAQGFRLTACASPIALGGVEGWQTITAVTPVAFLAPPGTIGTVEVDSPRNAIRPGQYFMARFNSQTGWRRASFLALSARETPGMRDVVRLRMLAEAQPAPERTHPRHKIDVSVAGHVVKAADLDPEMQVVVEVIDASPGGVCVESNTPLAVGDILYLEGPQRPKTGADFEVVRADPARINRYGGRFIEEAAGRELFSQLVEAAHSSRAERRLRHETAAQAGGENYDPDNRGGMHYRDHDEE
jgi:hypothetical protein